MGRFEYGDAPVEIAPTTDIVLQRLPIKRGDREEFTLHRTIRYVIDDGEPGGPFRYLVPPPDGQFRTDLASVPQLLTWLVPKSGRHLPAALIHDALVDDPTIDRFRADRIFRDAMGDLDVGLVRRWLMWTAVSVKTIQKRGTTSLRIGAITSAIVIPVLGVLATANLFVDRTLVPWMGSRHWALELVLGLAGAIVVPLVMGALLWRPIRIAGVIAGVAAAVLFHAMVLVATVYGLYQLVEDRRRTTQIALGTVVVTAASAAFAFGIVTAVR